ncbi:hypothetical protein T06_7732 [Trichinella sp. T6]|nr:hypothetical protein T06_7732 [Trichinella sp. T6]
MIFAKQFAKLTWTFPAVKNAGSLHSSQRNCRNHCVQCGKRLYQIGFPIYHQRLLSVIADDVMIVLCNGCCQYVYYSTCGKRLYQIGFPIYHQRLLSVIADDVMIVLCNGCCQYVYYSTVMNCRNKHRIRLS